MALPEQVKSDTLIDRIRVTGQVVQLDRVRCTAILRLPDGQEVICAGRSEDMRSLALALTNPEACEVTVAGQPNLNEDGKLDRIDPLDDLRVRLRPSPPPAAGPSIWQRIAERVASLPEEELEALPIDGAEQHDHYLYGSPKRPVS